MLGLALRRLLIAVPTLWIIITVAFFMMRLAPGGPFDQERALTPEVERNVMAAYDLDQPLIVQYGRYLGGLLTGDLGPSIRVVDFSVGELIASGFPASLTIGGSAVVLALVLGVALGSAAALNRGSVVDHLVMTLAMTGIALPVFVTAPLLTLLFGITLGWLPIAGWGSGALSYKILPIVSLALPQVAFIARLTRGAMVEVLTQPFIRTAHAKGLPERIVLLRHALRPSLLPVVSYLGPATAQLITGSVVIETIFGIPGIGRYFIQGALNRDYPLVLGVVVFFAALILMLNLLVDLLYGVLDPRTRTP